MKNAQLLTANHSKAWVIVSHSASRSPFKFCHGGYKRAPQNQALPYLQRVSHLVRSKLHNFYMDKIITDHTKRKKRFLTKFIFFMIIPVITISIDFLLDNTFSENVTDPLWIYLAIIPYYLFYYLITRDHLLQLDKSGLKVIEINCLNKEMKSYNYKIDEIEKIGFDSVDYDHFYSKNLIEPRGAYYNSVNKSELIIKLKNGKTKRFKYLGDSENLDRIKDLIRKININEKINGLQHT